MEEPFEDYIYQANQAAMQGSWDKTLEFLLLAQAIQPDNIELLNAIGGTYLQLGNVGEAVSMFARIVELTPDSSAAHHNLAAVYRLWGRWAEAERSYRQTLQLNSEDRTAWKGLSYVCLQQGNAIEGVEILAALVKSDPLDAEAMVMLAECYEEGDDNESARLLYEKALSVEPTNEIARSGLERTEKRMETNSAQKKAELARKLAALKQKSPIAAVVSSSNHRKTAVESAPLNVAVFGPAQVAVEIRLAPLVQSLVRFGHRVQVSTRFDVNSLANEQTVLFSRAHLSEELSRGMEQCKQKGMKVILDLDEDFITPRPSGQAHPNQAGRNKAELERLETILNLADVVTVPTEQLVKIYQPYAKQIVVIPYSWDDQNPMWKKAAPRRSHFQLGFVGGHTQPEDLEVLKKALIQLMDEENSALVGVVADLNLLSALEEIPEERKFYLPPGKLEDYPYLLANFDVLLFPFKDNAPDRLVSDLALLEAGAREIPWIASPTPAFEAWQEGGVISRSEEEWKENMIQFLRSKDVCRKYAQAGAEKAQSRRADVLLKDWLEVLAPK